MALSAASNICLKSEFNKRYLRYEANRSSNNYGLMQFNAADLTDPYIQLEVVEAYSECIERDEDIIHLKCRYNNKFLARWLPDREWISASSDSPNEDETSWNCTMFRQILVRDGDVKQIRLEHVQMGYNLAVRSAPGFDSYLCIGSDDAPEPSKRDLFSVVLWDSLLKLPKRVAFKGDGGSADYLGIYMSGRPYLRFTFKDPKDPMVENEIFQTDDGIVCIKNTYTGKYWTVTNEPGYDRLLADAEDPRLANDLAGMFRLNPLGVNSVAFLSMSNKKYSKRYTSAVGSHFFSAIAATVDTYATLEVVDLDKLP